MTPEFSYEHFYGFSNTDRSKIEDKLTAKIRGHNPIARDVTSASFNIQAGITAAGILALEANNIYQSPLAEGLKTVAISLAGATAVTSYIRKRTKDAEARKMAKHLVRTEY